MCLDIVSTRKRSRLGLVSDSLANVSVSGAQVSVLVSTQKVLGPPLQTFVFFRNFIAYKICVKPVVGIRSIHQWFYSRIFPKQNQLMKFKLTKQIFQKRLFFLCGTSLSNSSSSSSLLCSSLNATPFPFVFFRADSLLSLPEELLWLPRPLPMLLMNESVIFPVLVLVDFGLLKLEPNSSSSSSSMIVSSSSSSIIFLQQVENHAMILEFFDKLKSDLSMIFFILNSSLTWAWFSLY